MEKLNGHEKRVTLNLARLSAAARKRVGLVEALEAAHQASWDLNAISQENVEIIYANFDAELEAEVRGEFEADPEFLVDNAPFFTACPLCGHVGIRWEFRLANKAGGTSINCGSECIITYGLSVKGAETAEHARKILEDKIRKAIRALEIVAWLKETGFQVGWFEEIRKALRAVKHDYSNGYYDRREASVNLWELRKLEKFFAKSGWLNTESKWSVFAKVVDFARARGLATVPALPPFKSKEEKKAMKKEPLIDVVAVLTGEPKPEVGFPTEEEAEEAEATPALVIEEVREVPVLPPVAAFSGIAYRLVFAAKGV